MHRLSAFVVLSSFEKCVKMGIEFDGSGILFYTLLYYIILCYTILLKKGSNDQKEWWSQHSETLVRVDRIDTSHMRNTCS